MCGIRVLVMRNEQNEAYMCAVPEWLERRGPDAVQQVSRQKGHHTVILQASVLQMRQELVRQPVAVYSEGKEREKQMYLAWNGEIYQRLRSEFSADSNKTIVSLDDTWSYGTSDTRLVAKMIQEACHDGLDLLETSRRVLSKLVNAEYAFCILTDTAVYYGRDVLGRRSLLVWQSSDDTCSADFVWELASVTTTNASRGAGGSWTEVQPGRVYCYNWMDGSTTSCPLKVSTIPLPLSPPLHSSFEAASGQLQHLLLQAVQRRVVTNSAAPCAILFSGGLDSAVLAALVCTVLPTTASIELINVSFVDHQHDQMQQHTTAVSADTLAAQACFAQLRQLYPHHAHLRLIQQQADWTEITAAENHMRDLLYPKTTLMDVNIATALWFAAKAAQSRLLLSGLGADEQMGGYGRHRKAYKSGALRQELDMDMARLWERNLGRDDRVLSDHGREARFPYLDANVVDYLARLPLELVCDFSLPPGQGDKRILRLVAEQMGLKSASVAVKRAIQFGSRISHVSDKRRFGSRRKASGTKECASDY